MPFIWNDEQMQYLDDSVEFDRSQFAVVRKLFIQFKDHEKDIGEHWMKEKFQRFGAIERVELFRNENDIIWSYLTFSNDNEAYLAFKGASTFNEIDEILPADTWSQPEPPKRTAEMSNIIPLIDAMNRFEIANRGEECRKDVSNSLLQLVALYDSMDLNSESIKESMANKILPLAKTFTFDFGDPKCPLALSQVRSILRNIGPHVCELAVRFKVERWPKYISRYFFKMCQYVGKDLKIMRLKYVPPNEDWLQQLKPLLSRIECLHVQICNYDFDFDIDFQSYCPNLKTLKISMNLKGELLTRPWPKLESLSIRDNQYMEERLVLEFMKNNPQLTYLKIDANDSNNLLKQIPLHLANLEKLCLYQAYPNICADNLVHLIGMTDLKKLKLMYLDADDFNGIVNCLPNFKQLQELKLHIFYDGIDSVDLDELHNPIFESIICLAEELSLLECFHIRYCQMDTATLYSFIRSAKKLKNIGIYRCALEINDDVLENIEAIRNAINPTMLLLYADKVSSELNKESRIKLEIGVIRQH